MTPSRLVAILLGLSVALAAGAWRLQGNAASDLGAALEAQAREVPESDGEPPDPADYRAILATLQRSIEIRRDIEVHLRTIEEAVASLEGRQEEAADTITTASSELGAIGRALGGAVGASRSSLARVDVLQARLGVSARLARLIAEELEELDRRLGPSAGRRP